MSEGLRPTVPTFTRTVLLVGGMALATFGNVLLIIHLFFWAALVQSELNRDQYLIYLVFFVFYGIFAALALLIGFLFPPGLRLEWRLLICASPLVLPVCLLAYLWLGAFPS